MARPTKCPNCKETTYHRDSADGRLCNLCDAPKPLRKRTAKSQAKIDRIAEFAKRYGL